MALTLDDIIKTERDRLFVIDRECFIVFTGDSLDDEKPFIRIGTYVDLPVEIIPLVENIVITDTMVGNPAIEQFNIDITYLDTNRFIGSRARSPPRSIQRELSTLTCWPLILGGER